MTTTPTAPKCLTHIRVGAYCVPRSSNNWTVAHHGDRPGHTLCGADITDRDIMERDAKSIQRKQWAGWTVCNECQRRFDAHSMIGPTAALRGGA